MGSDTQDRFARIVAAFAWDYAAIAAKRTENPKAPPDALEWYAASGVSARDLEEASNPEALVMRATIEAATLLGESLGPRLFDGALSIVREPMSPSLGFDIGLAWHHHSFVAKELDR